jgi:hypothetical protein
MAVEVELVAQEVMVEMDFLDQMPELFIISNISTIKDRRRCFNWVP